MNQDAHQWENAVIDHKLREPFCPNLRWWVLTIFCRIDIRVYAIPRWCGKVNVEPVENDLRIRK